MAQWFGGRLAADSRVALFELMSQAIKFGARDPKDRGLLRPVADPRADRVARCDYSSLESPPSHVARRLGRGCGAGQFHIWAAAEVDEAVELLTNGPAGRTNAGEYPPESLHRAVTDRLARYAEQLRVMSAEENKVQPVS
jgi:hypothetical protein